MMRQLVTVSLCLIELKLMRDSNIGTRRMHSEQHRMPSDSGLHNDGRHLMLSDWHLIMSKLHDVIEY